MVSSKHPEVCDKEYVRQEDAAQDIECRLHVLAPGRYEVRGARRLTMHFRGRRHAQRDGYRTATTLFGAPLELRVSCLPPDRLH